MSDQSYASSNVAQAGAPAPPAPVVTPPQTVMGAPPVTAPQGSQPATLPLTEVVSPPRVFAPPQTVSALPPPPPPVATPQMMLMPVVPMMAPPPPPAVVVIGGMEMDPLCEGLGMADCGACLLATYCPCMAVGEIAESIGMDECLACCSYASICFFCSPSTANCVHGCHLAQTFRDQTGYNTNDSACMTCHRHYIYDGKSCAMAPFLSCPLACFGMSWLLPLACLMPPCSCALTQELRLARRIKAQQTTVVTTGPVRQMM